MGIPTNNVTFMNFKIRLFFRRKDAIGAANALTRIRDIQHRAEKVSTGEFEGWVVTNINGDVSDADGVFAKHLGDALLNLTAKRNP